MADFPRAEGVASRVFNEAVGGLSDVADYFKLDPVPPVWRELKRYNLGKLRADAISATTMAIVTIPQAIGFALVVGLPVQAVIVTAIIGSFFCALYSTSHHLVFGPTNTISIILAGALLTVAEIPLTPLQKVLVVGFMIGAFQIAAGFLKLGNLTHFISRTVIIAYSTAVALLIGIGQVSNMLGLGRASDVSLPGTLRHIAVHLATFQLKPVTAAVGVASLLIMILIKRLRPNWPDGLIVIILFAAVSAALRLDLSGVRLVRDAGEVAGGMPLFVGFPLNEQGLKLVPLVASAALATSILGMLETISITKSIAARSGQKINPNQELMAMGIGNLAATAFGAMPGSSSFVRSAVCYESGAVTQMSSLLSSLMILAILLVCAPLVNYVPIATLAAYLILIAVKLVKLDQIRITVRSTRADAVVFWVTLAAALVLNLDTAIYVGIGVSLGLFLKKASAPSLVEYGFNEQGQLAQLDRPEERKATAISIVHVEGELFFGAADLFQEQVRYLADDGGVRVVILRMKNARHLDATSVMSLLQLHSYLLKTNRHLLISGSTPDVERVLKASGALKEIGRENIFPAEANLTMSTKRALVRASQLLKQHGEKGSTGVRIYYDRKRENEGSGEGADTGSAESPDYEI